MTVGAKDSHLFHVNKSMKNIQAILGKTREQILSMVDDYVVESIVKLGEMREPTYGMGTVQYAWTTLLDALTKGRSDMPCSPEEVTAILIRGGLPREKVKATSGNITLTLPNGCYRIYRTPSGYPTGAFTLRFSEWMRVRHGLTAEELADFLMEFDKLIPEIEERERPLLDEYDRRIREIKAESMATDIARQSLEAIFEKLDHLQLAHDILVHEDGTITVLLEQVLTGGVRAPLNELKELLSDEEKVRALLTPKTITRTSPFPLSRRRH